MVHASQDLTRSTSEFRQPRAEIDDLASRTARLRVILIILMPWDGMGCIPRMWRCYMYFKRTWLFFLLMFKQHAGFVIVWLQFFFLKKNWLFWVVLLTGLVHCKARLTTIDHRVAFCLISMSGDIFNILCGCTTNFLLRMMCYNSLN